MVRPGSSDIPQLPHELGECEESEDLTDDEDPFRKTRNTDQYIPFFPKNNLR